MTNTVALNVAVAVCALRWTITPRVPGGSFTKCSPSRIRIPTGMIQPPRWSSGGLGCPGCASAGTRPTDGQTRASFGWIHLVGGGGFGGGEPVVDSIDLVPPGNPGVGERLDFRHRQRRVHLQQLLNAGRAVPAVPPREGLGKARPDDLYQVCVPRFRAACSREFGTDRAFIAIQARTSTTGRTKFHLQVAISTSNADRHILRVPP